MTEVSVIQNILSRLARPQDQIRVQASVAEHVRNGRGFWPVVMVDGLPQVIRFANVSGHGHDRWTPATGAIDVIALHDLSPTDWPRVRMV